MKLEGVSHASRQDTLSNRASLRWPKPPSGIPVPREAASVCPVHTLLFLHLCTAFIVLHLFISSFIHSLTHSAGATDWEIIVMHTVSSLNFQGPVRPLKLQEGERRSCVRFLKTYHIAFSRFPKGQVTQKRLRGSARDRNCYILKQMTSPFGRQAG